jgi:hypothetical protein
MKTKRFMLATAIVACGCAMTLTSCEKDNAIQPYQEPQEPALRVLTFEDKDYKADVNIAGEKSWSSLIDEAQYGGPLLYPEDETLYNWNDANNTFLAHELPNGWGDFQFWGSGMAVSNYIEQDVVKGTYMTQLSIPVASGHNGSSNFCVVFSASGAAILPSLYFYDGVERVIDHMYVVPTTYLLNSEMNGDGFAQALTAEGTGCWIVATGFDANGEETGTARFDLAKDGKFVTDWTKFDLSSLGKVAKVTFLVDGTDKGMWGLNTPGYFALDDVAVRF